MRIVFILGSSVIECDNEIDYQILKNSDDSFAIIYFGNIEFSRDFAYQISREINCFFLADIKIFLNKEDSYKIANYTIHVKKINNIMKMSIAPFSFNLPSIISIIVFKTSFINNKYIFMFLKTEWNINILQNYLNKYKNNLFILFSLIFIVFTSKYIIHKPDINEKIKLLNSI